MPFTRLHIILFITLLTGIFKIYAQEPESKSIPIPKKNDSIPSKIVQDSLPKALELPIAQRDTTRQDSVKIKKGGLDSKVTYTAKDTVKMQKRTERIYLYNEAQVTYEDLDLKAGIILIDNKTNNIYARGIIDSTGAYTQAPVFVQGNNEVQPDSIIFNKETKKAIVYNSRTQQGEINIIGEVSKRINDTVIYLRNAKFTTSKNIDDPEYYFYARKIKFIPKQKIVTSLVNLYIADVPTPLGLPFGFFPLSEERTSGIILPTFGNNNQRGFFIQNAGYYLALSDYYDLALFGDYFTNGSYGMRAQSNYAKRYKFRGNVGLRFENLLFSERGFPDFSQNTIYNIQWTHTQDPKANPNSSFSASVNLGSSQFFRQSVNQNTTGAFLTNTLNSSVSYQKTFPGEPQVNFSITATHSQNTQTENVNLTLPTFQGSVSRIFPFAPKNGVKRGAIQNINFQYNLRAENRINTTEDRFGSGEMFDDALIGAQHSIPISTNFKVAKHLSFTAGANFQETWTFTTFSRRFDPTANNNQGGIVQDTVRGFDGFRTYNFNLGMGTTVYGMWQNKNKRAKIQALRHVMRPSVNFSYSPGFNQFYEEVIDANGNVDDPNRLVFSRFEGTLFGAPPRNVSSLMSFGIQNNFEAKVLGKATDSTEAEMRKIKLVNNLSLSSAYDFAADSLNFSPVRVTGGIPIVEKLDLNFNLTLDPYALDNNNRRINTFNIDNGGSLFRLTAANISFNYSFSNKTFEGRSIREDASERLVNNNLRNGGRPDDLFGTSPDFGDGTFDDFEPEETNVNLDKDRYNFKIPWNLRLAYTMTYSNAQRQNEITSHSIMFSGDINISPRWQVGGSSGYDLKNNEFTFTQLRFQRDLESWNFSFNWVPFSPRTSWYFFIGIKANVFQDIKWDKRNEPDRILR